MTAPVSVAQLMLRALLATVIGRTASEIRDREVCDAKLFAPENAFEPLSVGSEVLFSAETATDAAGSVTVPPLTVNPLLLQASPRMSSLPRLFDCLTE